MYIASVNTPGYISENASEAFDTSKAAWEYLAEERRRDEEASTEGTEDYSNVVDALSIDHGCMTIYGFTPGGRMHDLGLAYSVVFDPDF